jgi:hypothetical protein
MDRSLGIGLIGHVQTNLNGHAGGQPFDSAPRFHGPVAPSRKDARSTFNADMGDKGI